MASKRARVLRKAGNHGINREALNAVLEFAKATQKCKSGAPAARPREHHRHQRGSRIEKVTVNKVGKTALVVVALYIP